MSSVLSRPTTTTPAVSLAVGSQLVVNATTFMVLPFAVVYLAETMGLGPARAGTVMGLLLLSSRFLAAATGPLAERIGYRAAMTLGLLTRGAGYALFTLGRDWASLAAAASVVGIGGALYEPALSGLLARRPAGDRLRLFVTRNQLLNAGVVVGPVTGAAVLALDPRAPFLLAATFLGVMGTAVWLGSPPGRGADHRPRVRTHYAKAMRSHAFLGLFAILVLWWALFTQLVVSIPLVARAVGGNDRWVGIAFLVNGTTGILALGGVGRLGREIPPARLLTWGLAIAAVGFAVLPLVASPWWFLVCVVIYTLGESLVLPMIDLLVASWTDDETASTFFGIALAAWGIGGAGGTLLGTWLMLRPNRALPWLVYGALGLITALATHVWSGGRRPSPLGAPRSRERPVVAVRG